MKATSPAQSPRVQTAKELQTDEVTNFNTLLANIVQVSSVLFKISHRLYKKGDASEIKLQFQDGTVWTFGRKDMKSAVSTLHKQIKELKSSFRVAQKRHRTADPEGLKGVYTPIFLGGPLRYFFTQDQEGFGPLNPANPDDKTPLMSQLQKVQEGFMLKNSMILLAYDYFRYNKLQDASNGQFINSNQHMVNSFNNEENPADFFTYFNEDEDKKTRITMSEAVERGIVERPLTVYEALSAYKPYTDEKGEIRMSEPKPRVSKGKVTGYTEAKEIGFNPSRFRAYFMQSIASYSFYSNADVRRNIRIARNQGDEETAQTWEAILENLTDPRSTSQLIREHAIIQNTGQQWDEILKNSKKEQKAK